MLKIALNWITDCLFPFFSVFAYISNKQMCEREGIECFLLCSSLYWIKNRHIPMSHQYVKQLPVGIEKQHLHLLKCQWTLPNYNSQGGIKYIGVCISSSSNFFVLELAWKRKTFFPQYLYLMIKLIKQFPSKHVASAPSLLIVALRENWLQDVWAYQMLWLMLQILQFGDYTNIGECDTYNQSPGLKQIMRLQCLWVSYNVRMKEACFTCTDRQAGVPSFYLSD